MKACKSDSEMKLKGIAVSSGIIIGKAYLVDRSKVKITYQYLVSQEQVSKEVKRLEDAIRTTREQLITIKNHMPENIKTHSFIIESHLMILKDSMFADASIQRILNESINSEWAVQKSLEEIREIFKQIDDEYIRNRIEDVENVAERVLRNLSGEDQKDLAGIDQRVIVVAHDLAPADTTELNLEKVIGFITDGGGRTSHTGIMAQALKLPAVVALETATDLIKNGDILIVDGNTGEVIINPLEGTIAGYKKRQIQQEKFKSSIARTSHLPAETLDGYRIAIKANIEFLEEVESAREYGGEAIGLYRTEVLYIKSKTLPTEEELFEDYRQVAEIIAPDPVTIRTLDTGGDKIAAVAMETDDEMNPALGLRAIRFCLKEPEIFKTQLRSILRASAYGKVQIMFPMISGLQEVLDARAILEQARQELDTRQIAYDHDIKVGIMIEIPSAVSMAEVLARHVDFFSIGTNDLIQYALAIDRINEHVAHIYEPFHPAISRMIQQVVAAARKAGINVSICGEMAGDPLCIPILLGLGLDELSMNARSIPFIKKIIREISMKDARLDFENILKLSTAKEIRGYIINRMKALIPELEGKGYLYS
ncbi:MAG: phosphoenolpyruvate--protein phosphotransferase [Deltaproteobacteria bacterium]|nr:phosphoenolpyruvate--protein phosphotransferase [Deltaproteobacteria bacterium]